MPSQDTTGSVPRPPQDRREFFRIQDRIGLEIRRLEENHPADPDLFNNTPLDSLKAEYRRLDQDIKNHLANLAERDRLLTGLITTLNSKLDALARIIAFEQNPLQPEDWQDVTLSEGGLAFFSPSVAWQTGDRMAVRMTLPPELYQPQAIAQVIDLERDTAGGAWVLAAFTELEESDRQQIARHVMRWQIRQKQNQ
ncbi:PilZ domain-containing protein [Marinobacter litoralis]|uniref:PilZ domain-containing protein n=1 Tax=Marinobacter litoralis TaxID=187981 RepID=UPI0018EBFF4E|nr:PilZ domain-containing protein [Marinobacter litoralis]MBJ6137613.1 PilZ domain-containing protein [Marinobacter litoralis]